MIYPRFKAKGRYRKTPDGYMGKSDKVAKPKKALKSSPPMTAARSARATSRRMGWSPTPDKRKMKMETKMDMKGFAR